MNMDLMLELHRNMPRQGPGNSESTRRAFKSVPKTPKGVRIRDVGCGPGAQTLDLARLAEPIGGQVVAVDLYEQYIAEARLRAEQCGYRVLDHFTLSKNAWFEEYYAPLEKRFELFSGREGYDELIAMEKAEIELYRDHSDCYGYEFFILQQ